MPATINFIIELFIYVTEVYFYDFKGHLEYLCVSGDLLRSSLTKHKGEKNENGKPYSEGQRNMESGENSCCSSHPCACHTQMAKVTNINLVSCEL